MSILGKWAVRWLGSWWSNGYDQCWTHQSVVHSQATHFSSMGVFCNFLFAKGKWAIWTCRMGAFHQFCDFLTFPSEQSAVNVVQGTGSRPCCMRSLQKGKRQVRRYFILISFRQSLLADYTTHLCTKGQADTSPEELQKGPLSSQGSNIVPLGTKKPNLFSSGPCNFSSTASVSVILIPDVVPDTGFPCELVRPRSWLFLVQGCAFKDFSLPGVFASWNQAKSIFSFLVDWRSTTPDYDCSVWQIYEQEIFWVLLGERWN